MTTHHARRRGITPGMCLVTLLDLLKYLYSTLAITIFAILLQEYFRALQIPSNRSMLHQQLLRRFMTDAPTFKVKQSRTHSELLADVQAQQQGGK